MPGHSPPWTFDIESAYTGPVTWFNPEAARIGSRHVQVFVPSVDRDGKPVPRGQPYWVDECLRVLGQWFGGATALPPARGVWRDDDAGGALVYDETVVVFSYVAEEDLVGEAGAAVQLFLERLGRETNQGEVGLFVDGTYYGFRIFDAVRTDADDDLEAATNE